MELDRFAFEEQDRLTFKSTLGDYLLEAESCTEYLKSGVLAYGKSEQESEEATGGEDQATEKIGQLSPPGNSYGRSQA